MKKDELAVFRDKEGQLGRAVPNGSVDLPSKIWLEGGSLRFRRRGPMRTGEPSPNMLAEFVRLTDADSVLAFATKWGVLDIGPVSWSNKLGDRPPAYLPGRLDLLEGAEPIEAWLFYSRRARALLNVCAALEWGKLGDLADWDEFTHLVTERPLRPTLETEEQSWDRIRFGMSYSVLNCYGSDEERLEKARNSIAKEVQQWLDCWKTDQQEALSDFAFRWLRDQKRWEIQLNYHGLLFPAIALQITLALAQADSLFTCSGCGLPYLRPRTRKRPKRGWANYCEQCHQDKVAQRRASDAYREKKAAKRMSSNGRVEDKPAPPAKST